MIGSCVRVSKLRDKQRINTGERWQAAFGSVNTCGQPFRRIDDPMDAKCQRIGICQTGGTVMRS